MKKLKGKPILLAKHSEYPYLNPESPIFLLPNGDIVCGNEIAKEDGLTRHQYGFISEYLKKKRLEFNISDVRYKKLIDIIEDLQNKGAKSISLKKLADICVQSNSICEIRDYKIKKIKHLAYKRFWRKRNRLSQENKWEEVNRLDLMLRAREEITNKLINKLL